MGCNMRWRNPRGISLIEILVASVIGALLAGGTLMAMTMGVKLTRGSVMTGDVSAYAAQTIERNRNRIACDDAWFNSNCTFVGPGGEQNEAPSLPTDSSLEPLPDVSRRFTVEAKDCDGDGALGDCYRMAVSLQWEPPERFKAP